MFGKHRWNTKLTSIEVRWIKNAYKEGTFKGKRKKAEVFGYKKVANKINEGREKAGIVTVHPDVVLRVIHKLKDKAVIIPIDTTAKITVCPKCGHKWYKQIQI